MKTSLREETIKASVNFIENVLDTHNGFVERSQKDVEYKFPKGGSYTITVNVHAKVGDSISLSLPEYGNTKFKSVEIGPINKE